MRENNPVIIPRNHLVEEILADANNNKLENLFKYLDLLQKPYNEISEEKYLNSPPPSDKIYKTFCGT